jgi:hypothetical protein
MEGFASVAEERSVQRDLTVRNAHVVVVVVVVVCCHSLFLSAFWAAGRNYGAKQDER